MSESWIIQNLEGAIDVWNGRLAEIWQLISMNPAIFKGGSIWAVILNIHSALQAIGYGLLVLFFTMGVIKTCGSFAELKRPEQAVKVFVRFAIAKGVIDYSLTLMLAMMDIVQGITSTVMSSAGFGAPQASSLPGEIIPYRQAVYMGSFICNDTYSLRQILPPLYVHSYCTYSFVILCRSANSKCRHQFYKILCRCMS